MNSWRGLLVYKLKRRKGNFPLPRPVIQLQLTVQLHACNANLHQFPVQGEKMVYGRVVALLKLSLASIMVPCALLKQCFKSPARVDETQDHAGFAHALNPQFGVGLGQFALLDPVFIDAFANSKLTIALVQALKGRPLFPSLEQRFETCSTFRRPERWPVCLLVRFGFHRCLSGKLAFPDL